MLLLIRLVEIDLSIKCCSIDKKETFKNTHIASTQMQCDQFGNGICFSPMSEFDARAQIVAYVCFHQSQQQRSRHPLIVKRMRKRTGGGGGKRIKIDL